MGLSSGNTGVPLPRDVDVEDIAEVESVRAVARRNGSDERRDTLVVGRSVREQGHRLEQAALERVPLEQPDEPATTAVQAVNIVLLACVQA